MKLYHGSLQYGLEDDFKIQFAAQKAFRRFANNQD